MPRTMSEADQSMRIQTLDSIRPSAAKAGLAVNGDQSALRGVVSESIRRVTTQKAAALDMGIDPAQLTRQLQNGHITVERLEALGPEFCAELGRGLIERFGEQAKSPKERARERLPELLRELLEATA